MRYFQIVAVVVLLWLAPATASAQDRTNAVTGFGGLSLNESSSPRPDFGVNVAKNLTPFIQVMGEFGRVDNMLPPFVADVLSFTPYDVRVSAFYGEGGVRFLAAPGSGITPYGEATAGIARLNAGVSGLGSRADALVDIGLNFLQRTEPIVGLGGGVLLRGRGLVVDLGYRYKEVVGNDGITSLLSAGSALRAHQVRFGVGVRF